MTYEAARHATLDDWIAHEAIPCSLDAPKAFNTAVDQAIASLGDSGTVLGVGEALHGGKEVLVLRNHLFQRLIEAHALLEEREIAWKTIRHSLFTRRPC